MTVIAIIAGESSGDQLGAGLIEALRRQNPNWRFIGVGGPAMRAAGCQIHWASSELSVMGLIEPIKHLPRLYRRFHSLVAFLKEEKPQVVIGIDAPDFTLRVERVMKAHGCRIIHYVSPSVWAWRKGRVLAMKAFVDEVLTLFPFETAIYKKYGVPVTCVGHPMADSMPLCIAEEERLRIQHQLGLTPNRPILALLPGSRVQEIERHLPLYLEVARILLKRYPTLQFVSAIPSEALKPAWTEVLKQYPDVALKVESATAKAAIIACDVALLTSGTVTLEAMLAKRPMVIAYRMNRLTYWLAKKLVRIPFFGLPNLLAQKCLVPEFLQEQATKEQLSEAVSTYLGPFPRAQLMAEFDHLHQSLALQGSERAAERVMAQVAQLSKECVHT